MSNDYEELTDEDFKTIEHLLLSKTVGNRETTYEMWALMARLRVTRTRLAELRQRCMNDLPLVDVLDALADRYASTYNLMSSNDPKFALTAAIRDFCFDLKNELEKRR